MRPPAPLPLNLSLNLLGVLSFALAANAAEASGLIAEDEHCSSCEGNRPPTEPTEAKKPAPAAVATRPAKPEAKAAPDFSTAVALAQTSEDTGVASSVPEAVSQPDGPLAQTPDQVALPEATQPLVHPAEPEGSTAPSPQTIIGLAHPEVVAGSTESGLNPAPAPQPSPVVSTVGNSPVSQEVRLNPPHRPRTLERQAVSSPQSVALEATALPGSTQKPLSLPRLASNPELPATDVASIWNRFIPVALAPPAQNWSRGLPTEALPATTVQVPKTQARNPAPSYELTRPLPLAVAQPQPTARTAPVLPTFEPPQPATQRSPRPEPAQPGAVETRADFLKAPTPAAVVPTAQANSPAVSPQREDLLIEPLATDPVARVGYPPSPNAGIPSAFGASWGDFFVSLTAAGADRLRPEVDGSISAGFGVGDPRTAVGVELAYNLLSIRNFAENGSFDAKIHREVFANTTTQAAVAVGWNNFATYGTDVAGSESSVYGVVSAAHLLQPANQANRLPITGTLGVGSGNFSGDNSDVGVIAGVGLQVDPRLSLNAAWSGVGLNLGASVAPFPTLPLTLNAVYGDVTNNTEAGSVATFTVGYGFNFGPRF